MKWCLVVALVVFMVAELVDLVTPASAPAPGPAGPWTGQSDGTQVHIRLVRKHHFSASAGGDVILGGFALAVVASVLCYIRVTRRDHQANNITNPDDDAV